MLDVSRHFEDKTEVERLLDLIGGRVPRHPEDFVVVAGHEASLPASADHHGRWPQLPRSFAVARSKYLDNRPGRAVRVVHHTDHLVTLRVKGHPCLRIARIAELLENL